MTNTIIFITGVYALYIIVLIQYLIKRKKGKQEVEATVIDIKEYYSENNEGDGCYVYLPTLEYDWNGYKRRVTPDAYSSSLNFEMGEKVKMLIDPKDASNFSFKKTEHDPYLGILLMPIFVICYILIRNFFR